MFDYGYHFDEACRALRFPNTMAKLAEPLRADARLTKQTPAGSAHRLNARYPTDRGRFNAGRRFLARVAPPITPINGGKEKTATLRPWGTTTEIGIATGAR